MCGVDAKERLVEVLYFKQYYRHFVFTEDETGNLNKRMEKYFGVSVVVDVGCGDTILWNGVYIECDYVILE